MSDNNISLVFPVMNRTHVLIQSVPTWLQSDLVDEVVIVDWSSKIPIYEDPLTQSIVSDPRVRIVRIDNEPFFLNPSFSINVGVIKATYPHILKLDIDYQLIDIKFMSLIKKLLPKLNDGFFITDFAYLEDLICMMGFVFFHKKHFEMVGGYNEIFRGWGYEDIHMYNKLSQVCQKYIISNLTKFIFHIPHDDVLRNENHIDKYIPIVDNERKNRERGMAEPPAMSQYKTIKTLVENDLIKYEIMERLK